MPVQVEGLSGATHEFTHAEYETNAGPFIQKEGKLDLSNYHREIIFRDIYLGEMNFAEGSDKMSPVLRAYVKTLDTKKVCPQARCQIVATGFSGPFRELANLYGVELVKVPKNGAEWRLNESGFVRRK